MLATECTAHIDYMTIVPKEISPAAVKAGASAEKVTPMMQQYPRMISSCSCLAL